VRLPDLTGLGNRDRPPLAHVVAVRLTLGQANFRGRAARKSIRVGWLPGDAPREVFFAGSSDERRGQPIPFTPSQYREAMPGLATEEAGDWEGGMGAATPLP
jgi:hypothetical protein